MKKIVVFYSLSGNTRSIAKRAAAKLKAALCEIRTVKTYPDDYDVLVSLGKRETESGYMPKLQPLRPDFTKYDTVVLGTPVWWYTYAPAVKSFMKSVDWKGKMVYPFATNGGWMGHTASDFKKALRGAMVYPTLNVRFDEGKMTTEVSAVNEWLQAIAEDGDEE